MKSENEKPVTVASAPYTERKQILDAMFSDERVQVNGSITDAGVTIGVADEEPYVTIVPCMDPTVKCPIGFLEVDGIYCLVSYMLREDLNLLRGTNVRDNPHLNVLEPINELLKKDEINVIVSGDRGGRFTYDRNRGEFVYGIDATQVARFAPNPSTSWFRRPSADRVMCQYRGSRYGVQVLDARRRQLEPSSYTAVAWGLVPIVHALVTKKSAEAANGHHRIAS